MGLNSSSIISKMWQLGQVVQILCVSVSTCENGNLPHGFVVKIENELIKDLKHDSKDSDIVQFLFHKVSVILISFLLRNRD